MANTTNSSSSTSNTIVSSMQALSALVWRCISRARRISEVEEVACILLVNNRRRFNPPLSDNYFGNCIDAVCAKTTAGELVKRSLRCVALMLNRVVNAHNDKAVRDRVSCAMREPFIVYEDEDHSNVVMVGSPWFDMYVNEFGMGKPIASFNGDSSKCDKRIILRPGREGGGSIDMEICLVPETMCALEVDEEFMGNVF